MRGICFIGGLIKAATRRAAKILAKDSGAMRRSFVVLGLLVATTLYSTAQTASPSDWEAKVSATMPLLGHRNWILIVDSAYPLQTSSGVETIETNAHQLDVVRYVLHSINSSIHVRPLIYMDAELPFVPDQDAPGASAYRAQIAALVHDYPVEPELHEKMLSDIDEAGKRFHILVLKTDMAISYTSVFIRLDCKYWSADQEKRLRAKMAAGSNPAQ
jgi:hypothetical protein